MKNGGCSLSNGKMSGAKVRKGTNYWLSEGQAVRKARLYVRDMVRQKCFKEVTLDTSLLFCNLHCVFLMGTVSLQDNCFLLELTCGIDGVPVFSGGSQLYSVSVKHIRCVWVCENVNPFILLSFILVL